MKQLLRNLIAGRLVAAALVLAGFGLGFGLGHAQAQTKPAPSAAAIAAAKEILTMKNVSSMYISAVPSTVQHTMQIIMQTNLNYQKDLQEVAVVVAKNMAGREKEIGDEMARIYASDFTEQELKDLVAFYKSPLGQKLLVQEPKSISSSIEFMNKWGQVFSAQVSAAFAEEMKKRGKPISG